MPYLTFESFAELTEDDAAGVYVYGTGLLAPALDLPWACVLAWLVALRRQLEEEE